ncbi:MAG: acetate--CoA ligase [Myxococcales bacterium]|nr:acetate--CoA ligase [Myxococcales bacterium]
MSVADRIPPPEKFRAQARVRSREQYAALHRESLDAPEVFWARELGELLPGWQRLRSGELPHVRWFEGASLNVSERCLDRHLEASGDKTALIWEGEPEAGGPEVRTLSYAELHAAVVAFAGALAALGVAQGERVVIYMGMVPEAVVAMLACARLGAVHSVVFGGFAAEALASRINDCGARVVVTQDGGWRRGAPLAMKSVVDAAVLHAPGVAKVVVLRRLGSATMPVHMTAGRDVWWDDALAAGDDAAGATPTPVDAEHPLFILYTSGSTGKPKGVLHTSAGYLAGVYLTCKYVFDLRPDDRLWCTADIGWVTGHSYVVYGPLANGATIVLYEGTPNAPDPGRLWRIVERHRPTILYTAPTAIRSFMRWGDEWPGKSDLSSLRLLGSVGEPIGPEAWHWYHRVIGGGRCPIVDTWWQTETGSILLTTLPGALDMQPGSAGLPMFGVEPEVVHADGTPCAADENGLLIIKRAWPSMLRTVWGNEERFIHGYFAPVPGAYFTGDSARKDADGYITVIGRVDDVLNVAGHRIGTAEVESAVTTHPAVVEAAAVGRPDELKGQALVVFVTLRAGHAPSDALRAEIRACVGREIGKFAAPDDLRFTDALPKTRSGKIMRRFLKDVAAGRATSGDTSTLEDLGVLARLQQPED